MPNKLIVAIIALMAFFMLLPEPDKASQTPNSSTAKDVASTESDSDSNRPLKNNAEFKAGIITDFNQNLPQSFSLVAMGNKLAATTDKIAGGNSEVQLSLVDEKQHLRLNNKSLQVSGELKPGFIYPWSGVAYLLSHKQQHGVKLSALNALEFSAKGSLQTDKLSVLLFQVGSIKPVQQDFELTNKWQTFQVKFNMLNLDNITNISFVKYQTLGPFTFTLDDLRFK